MSVQEKMESSLVDKNLSQWASEAVVARGRAYHQDGHVLDWEWDNNQLTAEVEGTGPEPYHVEITFDENVWPHSECECPFDWEPLCKHAVAALLEWRAEERGEEPEPAEPAAASEAPAPNTYLRDVERVERAARHSSAKDQNLRIKRRPNRSLLGEYHVASNEKNQDSLGPLRER